MRRWIVDSRVDFAIALLFMLPVIAAYFTLATQVPDAMTDQTLDAWVYFEADPIRLINVMTERKADNFRTNVHPLQALWMHPGTYLLEKAGLEPAVAAKAWLACMSGFWFAAMFGALRGLGLKRVEALAVTFLGISTGSTVFWLTVPEVYAFCGVSVALTFALGTLIQRGKIPAIFQAATAALSMSMTTTNWMAGILTVLSTNSYRRAIRTLADSLLIVTILFAAQKVLYRSASFFVPWPDEFNYLFHQFAGGPLERARAIFVYAIAVPEVPSLPNPWFPDWVRFSVQLTSMREMHVAGLIGWALWAILFVLGIVTALRNPGANRPIAQALMLFLLFQVLFHMVYGDEMFLYSMNYLPALILLSAFAFLGPLRQWALSTAVVATAFLAFNNVSEFLRLQDAFAQKAEQVISERAAESQ